MRGSWMANSDEHRGAQGVLASASKPPKGDWVGHQLRRAFDDTLNEPVPDEMLALLRQLDEPADSSKGSR